MKLVLLALLLLGLACARQSPRATGDPTDSLATEPQAADSVGVAALMHFGRSFGEDREAIRSSLGSPLERTARPYRNRHTGDTDSLIRLHYRHYTFHLYHVSAADRDLLMHVVAHSDAKPRPNLIVGVSTRREIQSLMSTPYDTAARRDTQVVTYRSPLEGGDEFVRLAFVADTLRSISWEFYVD